MRFLVVVVYWICISMGYALLAVKAFAGIIQHSCYLDIQLFNKTRCISSIKMRLFEIFTDIKVIRGPGNGLASNKWQALTLTHWGRVTHICVSKLTIIGSDNGLSPGRRQAIIWTNAGILLIEPMGTNFSENLIEILAFSLKQMHLKMSSGKCRPFCLGLNVL